MASARKGLGLEDLSNWIQFHAEQYESSSDDVVLSIAENHNGYISKKDFLKILKWKLQPNHFVAAQKQVEEFHKAFPTAIREKTKSACSADHPELALKALRGLPQMKTKNSVAVASCVLMVLDKENYTVIDRRANESLHALKPIIKDIATRNIKVAYLCTQLTSLTPRVGFSAVAEDWVTYLDICRELSRISKVSLRQLDRALYQASGDVSLMGKLK